MADAEPEIARTSEDKYAALSESERILRQIALGIALLMVAMVFLVFVVNIFVSIFYPDSSYFKNVIKPHLAVFLGLPQICAVSFAIVIFLRQTEGPFEFKVIGVEAKGASGQVVMWIFALASMTAAMHLVW